MYEAGATISEAYEAWKEYGFGDESRLVLHVIYAIYDHDSIEGLEDLPDFVSMEIRRFIEKYKGTGSFRYTNSNGEQDLTYYLEAISKHFE